MQISYQKKANGETDMKNLTELEKLKEKTMISISVTENRKRCT